MRGCCSCDDNDNDNDCNGKSSKPKLELTNDQSALASKLVKIVGSDFVHDGMEESPKTNAFLKGARLGYGSALCIVQPGSVSEAVKCLQEIVDADCVVVPQVRVGVILNYFMIQYVCSFVL